MVECLRLPPVRLKNRISVEKREPEASMASGSFCVSDRCFALETEDVEEAGVGSAGRFIVGYLDTGVAAY